MVNWWDSVYITLSIYGQGIFALLPGYGSATYDLAQRTLLAVTDLLVGLLLVIMYFPMRMFGVMVDLLNIVLAALAGLVNSIITFGNALVVLITGTFENVLPGPWVALLGIIILINVALRVYYFVKDISIAGFKI